MRNRSTRRLAALALALALGAAGCGGPAMVPPLGPPQPKTTSPPADDCLGAVVHTVSVGKDAYPRVSLCITLGGVVRVENLGPGRLHADSWDQVSCFYAAGVHTCRMIYTGTVRLRAAQPGSPMTITIEIAGPVSPPRPAPACTSEPFTLDAADYGPPWSALCVKTGTEMRVENLGTGGFSVSPPGALSCRDQEGVRECRFVEVATVTITVTRPDVEPRELIVVVIE